MNARALNPLPVPTLAENWLLPLATLVVGIAFFCTEHNLFVTTLEMYGTTAEDFESAGANLLHQFGFALLALLGGVCLVAKPGLRLSLGNLMAVLLIVFIAWCIVSVAWSIDKQRTAKRLVVMGFCFCGACGLGRQLPARDLCTLAAAITASYAALGLGMELVLGTFKPASAEYRFAGTLHPNSQGGNCAILCLATLCLFRSWTRGRWLLVPLLLFGAGLLVITKSRTSCVALGIGLFAIWAVRTPLVVKVCAAMTAAFSGSLLALLVLVCGDEFADKVMNAILLGRSEHAGTLTGRTELWEELLKYIAGSPIIGYGYTGFWNKEHVSDISEDLYWGISSAHSVYLELLLGVGVIGAMLFLLAVACGMFRAARRYQISGDIGYGFILALLLYGAMDGITESSFLSPSFLTFLAGCGLAHLAFFRESSVATFTVQPSKSIYEDNIPWLTAPNHG